MRGLLVHTLRGVYNLMPDKRLGSAKGKHRYDLPLNQDNGAGFLMFLIALMTFLAIIALNGSFILERVTQHWSSGLENKITIEIPAENNSGQLRRADEMQSLTKKVTDILRGANDVRTFDVLDQDDIRDLVSPWLGQDMSLDGLPLPGIISVEMHQTSLSIIEELQTKLEKVNKNIHLDTHEDWLNDLLHITGALQSMATFITLIILLTTIVAVAASIRMRMALHREDVELLHLMGASDPYITKQFQRHALILGLKGSALGGGGAFILLSLLGVFLNGHESAMMPHVALSTAQVAILFCVPVAACMIATLAARFTVLRSLGEMP